MKTLWILAAAATFAACHNRGNDETGAAPDRGDTTKVSGYDTTKTSQTRTGYDTTSAVMPQPGAYDSTNTGTSSSTGVGTDTTMSPAPGASSTGTPSDSSWKPSGSMSTDSAAQK
jgi:hypothetical protein